MKIITDIDKMRTYSKIMRKDGKLIGFVPTMGYFHEGHLSLIRAARKQADIVIVSIFVNPLQFGPDEDFERYPRDRKRDEEMAKSEGVDILFCPRTEDMYPDEYSTYVEVERLTENLCGGSRPGHFRGVCTVVLKLFEITKPDIVYFGQKDAQQAFVIKRMIEDLNLDIVMKIMPIVRESDGLAMSSRNVYLSESERKDATILYKSIKLAEELAKVEMRTHIIIKKMRELIQSVPSVKIDYISIVDTKTLQDVKEIKGEVLIAVAIFIGKTRLIDNAIIKERDEDETTS